MHAGRWDDVAAWYEVLNAWGADDHFYLDLVMSAESVLDVGCGTGRLLHRARDLGHAGRLTGLDPDPAMLAQARRRADIEWVSGDAASASWDQEFELAVMAGHAFQVFVEDDDLRKSLTAIRSALVDRGRFAFETRHPQARTWERWNTSFDVTNPDGETMRVEYEVHEVRGDIVVFTETFVGRWWDEPQSQRGVLRFLGQEALASFLHDAGFEIEEQFGAWNRGPITGESEEIITIVRPR
jgi:SAM-dependent methyltransferase